MEQSGFRTITRYAVLASILIGNVCLAQDAATGKQDTQSGAQRHRVGASEEVHVQDRVTAKLTLGQKKAIENGKTLGPNSAALFKADGTLLKKGSVKEFDKAFKACKDLQPISDKCWVCKDNGTIICSVSSPQSEPHSPDLHEKPN